MFMTNRALDLQTVKFLPERMNDSFHCSAYKCWVDDIIWIDIMPLSILQNPSHLWGSTWEQVHFWSRRGSKILFSIFTIRFECSLQSALERRSQGLVS